MNDKEQTRLIGSFSIGVFGGVYGGISIYFVFVEPLGLGSVIYVLAGPMSAAMIGASFLLVRQQLTRWETTATNIEQLRSRSWNCVFITPIMFQYHNLPDLWQPIAAVVIALAAAFATIRLSRPLYEIICTPSESLHTR